MSGVGARTRAELRARWRSLLGLALLVGLFSGAVSAAWAGARRTDSAYPRFLQAMAAPDVLVFQPPGDSSFASIPTASLAALPGVTDVGVGVAYQVVRPAAVELIAPTDRVIGGRLLRRRVLSGRAPDPTRADEVSISFVLAQASHLQVGGVLHLDVAGTAADGSALVRPLDLRIVGIDAAPTEFPPQMGSGTQAAWVTPAFWAAHRQDLPGYGITAIRLRDGAAGIPALETAISALAEGKPVQAFPLVDQSVNTQRSIHLQAVSLRILALLLAASGILVVTQVLIRRTFLAASDFPVLRALGFRQNQLWATPATSAAIVGVGGALVGVVVALAASPLLPVGLAADAEPSPGIAFDALALGLVALATIVVVAAAGALASVRSSVPTTSGASTSRTSSVAGLLGRIGAPISVETGVRFALVPGRGRNAVPLRSTVVGAAVGVAALCAALVFGTSLNHLLRTPPLYGVNWSAEATTVVADNLDPAVTLLRADSRVEDVGVGYTGFPLEIDGVRVDGMAMDTAKGHTLLPVPIEGRLPEQPDEIMLGPLTARALHAHIGTTFQATLAGTAPKSFRVVGLGIFPSLSDALGLGRGAATTVSALTRTLGPDSPPPPPDSVLVRYRPGADTPALTAALDTDMSGLGDTIATPAEPVDLVNFGRVQNLPLILAGLLGGLATATLVHLLLSSIRRRRRDMAVLKTVGLAPRDLRRTIGWQAVTLALLALAAGLPAGTVVGRQLWVVFAHQLGIQPQPTIRLLPIGLLVGATIVIALLVAVTPAQLAARTRPAAVLRIE